MNKFTKGFALILLVVFVCSLIVTPSIALAETITYPLPGNATEISNAIDYLSEEQSTDGGIGDVWISAHVVMALAAVGEDPHDFQNNGVSIIDYLENNADQWGTGFTPANDWSTAILALVAAEENPYNFDGTDYVSTLKTFYDGVQIGDSTLLNDDFWAIIALVSAGEPKDSWIIKHSKQYILQHQQVDGGWAYDTDAAWGTDVDSTGAAIMALIATGEDAGSAAITDGLDYIKDNQGTDGGFQSWGASNADTDSSGIWAIVACGQDPTSADWTKNGNNPIDHLLSLQTDTGVFEYTPGTSGAWPARTTAQAIIALTEKAYPVELIDLANLLVSAEDQVSTHEDTIASLESDISTLEDTVTTLENDLNTLEETVATTQSDLNSLEDKVNTNETITWAAFGIAIAALILGLAGILIRRK